jgi:DNA polymerase
VLTRRGIGVPLIAVTRRERAAALQAIADEVATCRRCRLHEGRTRTVPGEGHPSTEVAFVGEGPGFHEDQQGRPFVGAAGRHLEELLGAIGWRREEVFITNVVKCRPPGNRDPEPDEIAACAPFLRRQLEALDPALVVTLGRHSLEAFRPGARISQAHGTVAPAPAGRGADGALHLALYHPAAALRSTAIRDTLALDAATIPATLERARAQHRAAPAPTDPAGASAADGPAADTIEEAVAAVAGPSDEEQMGLFR